MADFISFKDLLPKTLLRYQLDRQARAAWVCSRFRSVLPEVVGMEASRHARPKYFKGGVLYVSVSNSLWAQQVYVHRHELLAELNKQLDKPWVKDLRTVVE